MFDKLKRLFKKRKAVPVEYQIYIIDHTNKPAQAYQCLNCMMVNPVYLPICPICGFPNFTPENEERK